MAAQTVLPLLLSPQALLLYLLLIPVLLLLRATNRRSAGERAAADNHGGRPLPSPPNKLPLIGHLHLVGPDPHVSLAALAAKHGDGGLMLLRLGQTRALVVSSPRAAEAVLRTHDHVFASRPPNAFADALLDGGADVAFAPYGEFWRQARRLVTTHLLSARKVHSLRRGREEEARLVMAKIQGAAAAGAQEDEEADFVDVLLSLQEEYSLTRQHIKAILMDMFVAGTDTSYIVLECAMAELMRKPNLMAKLQAEAVVKETLRLHPPAPLLLPHLSMAECDIDGYKVPVEARVIVNAWALGRDPGSWEAADEFMPERFVDVVSPDFKGRDFQFLPFGAGRRICPGINFGMASVEIMLANLVYCYDWELPGGMRQEELDMTGVFGMTMRRKERLFLVPRTRC
uniref:Uncharacterized protein n=1 Tax=Aegilops tauschii subsp. strangulata TaxID=200361 RepID=A0A453NDT1_AEGTS